MTTLSIIVAMANNRAIGKDNQLPWHLPEDLQRFKYITMGKPIIMGRKTFESIGRALPGRLNIVVTRQSNWQYSGVRVAHSLDDAIQLADAQAFINNHEEMMLIGGAELYRSALPQVNKIYLTRIETTVDADAFFPELTGDEWIETARENHQACEPNPHDYAFCTLERVRS